VCFINQTLAGKIILPQRPRGSVAVHHTDVSAGPQLRQRLEQDRAMMRHRAVGEAEQHGIEQFGRLIVCRVVLHQGHVPPLKAVGEAARPRQHSRRQIDAIDVTGITHRRAQIG
jgi:hypothetical protein